jgi:hypothetical protein
MDQKSNGLSRFVRFFINEDVPVTPPNRQSPAGKVPVPEVSNQSAWSPPAAEGVVDRKYLEHFEQLMEQSNIPGTDYFEFTLALKNMAHLGLTEDKLYQATYATFQALGGNAQVLLDTAQQYIQILRGNQAEFEQQVREKTDHSVGSKSQERDTLITSSQQYAQQILDLQAKIEANNARVAVLNEEITVETARIHHQQRNYQTTLAQFVGKIEADILKIKQHLTNY